MRVRSIAGAVALLSIATAGYGDDCGLRLELAGGSVDLSTGLTTQRRAPAVAHNATDNEYIVVWFDTRNPGNNDIFAQRVAADGGLLGSNIAVMEFVDAQIDPFVAYTATDNTYFAAWRTQQPGNFNRSRGRIIEADGSLPEPDFFVSTGGLEISIAYNSTSNEFFHEGRGNGIIGRRVSAAGAPIGSDIVISNVGAPAPCGQVTYNGNANEYLATWRNQTDDNLQGRRISAAGALLGAPIPISATFPASGRASSNAFDSANDRYLVTFGIFQGPGIEGQLVAGDGSLIGANFTITNTTSSSVSPYVVHAVSENAFVLAWREGGDINAQLLLDDGSTSGSPLVVAEGTATGGPRLAYNGASGEVLVVWSDNQNIDDGEEDIFARRIRITDARIPGDLDCDGRVGVGDLLALFAAWGPCRDCDNCPADLDGDCTVGVSDLLILFANWG